MNNDPRVKHDLKRYKTLCETQAKALRIHTNTIKKLNNHITELNFDKQSLKEKIKRLKRRIEELENEQRTNN